MKIGRPRSPWPPPPGRANGMDYKLRRQAVALFDFGLSHFTTVQGAALSQQIRPGSAVNGARQRPTAQQALVGGVDDGIFMVVISFRTNCRGMTAPPRFLVSSYHKCPSAAILWNTRDCFIPSLFLCR